MLVQTLLLLLLRILVAFLKLAKQIIGTSCHCREQTAGCLRKDLLSDFWLWAFKK
jgi:hypothetical protein